MNESELLRDRISKFITLFNDLKNIKVKFNDEDQAMLLLYFLPSSYKSFRETLIYGRDKLSFEDVKGHLLSKDKLNKEFGHVKANCYKLRNKRDTESNEKDLNVANLADKSGDDFLLVSTSDNFELTFEWILDSRCSFHMCPIRELFSTYNLKESHLLEYFRLKRLQNQHRAFILLKGIRTDSLYILEGSTVTGETRCPSFITESKSTRLERR
ncbi:hypothetical protein Goklo_029043 [Gossypium klotzschianum]|uniref:Retrovirus-related Pol polyprotein from transposon TNT 1-94 n=1 Tax=Gossypium klotzschianum TaxID=34286 RepID=A0A7J8WAE2_9ROSI|nr:hypothetical protein [Gossypium klotzschianum]